MKRIVFFIWIIAVCFGLTACSGFEDTPETDAAFAAYEAAVKQSVLHKKGQISVYTENEDTVVENTKTAGVIEYAFEVDENDAVSFERNDFTDGKPVAAYYADGKAVYEMEMETGEWKDITESSAELLVRSSNYFNMLALFRIDHNFRYSKRFYESVSMEEADGGKTIRFVLKSNAISNMFTLSDERGIRREMASQTRTFTVNEKGDLEKIVIDSRQNVLYQGSSGTLANVITVTLDYTD